MGMDSAALSIVYRPRHDNGTTDCYLHVARNSCRLGYPRSSRKSCGIRSWSYQRHSQWGSGVVAVGVSFYHASRQRGFSIASSSKSVLQDERTGAWERRCGAAVCSCGAAAWHCCVALHVDRVLLGFLHPQLGSCNTRQADWLEIVGARLGRSIWCLHCYIITHVLSTRPAGSSH